MFTSSCLDELELVKIPYLTRVANKKVKCINNVFPFIDQFKIFLLLLDRDSCCHSHNILAGCCHSQISQHSHTFLHFT